MAVVALYTSCRCWRHRTVHDTHVLRTLPTGGKVPECKISGTQESHDTAIGRHLTPWPVTWLKGNTTGRSTSASHMVKTGLGWRFFDCKFGCLFFKYRVIYKTSLEVRELRPLMITRFKTVVPTLLACFRQRGMRPRNCKIGFANSPAAQVTLNSVTSRFHQVTLNAVLPYGMSSYSNINIFAASKSWHFLKKIKFYGFLWGSVCLLLEFNKLLERKSSLIRKCIPIFETVLSLPFRQEHAASSGK